MISIGRSGGDFRVDISDSASIRTLFEQTGKFDALICAAGSVNFVPLGDMRESDFELGLRDKLMGQINLLLIGREYANDGASFTFTSGILNRDPIRTGASASLVNGAIDAFVKPPQSNCRAACASTPSARPCCWKPWAAMRRTFVATNRRPAPRWHWPTRKVSKACRRVRLLSLVKSDACRN